MNYELLKNEFIELKKEELDYINKVSILGKSRKLSEKEKIEIYRNIKSYQKQIDELSNKLIATIFNYYKEYKNGIKNENKKDIVFEIQLDNNYLSSISGCARVELLELLRIDPDTFKYTMTISDLRYKKYGTINYYMLLNKQKIIDEPVFLISGYYDYAEDCYGPLLGDPKNYLYVLYKDLSNGGTIEIKEKDQIEFEKDKMIIHTTKYVHSNEANKIFNEELLNKNNKTIHDCVIKTENRIKELNYVRSPEYKEKVLLDKINELYQKVKGEFIKREILYSGDFLEILRETYKLPNEKTIEKEKVIKNGGKNSVVVIAITQDKEYIITFQNRIKNKKIAEFPSGYIENGEDPIEAAKRELQEETGYISDDLFIVDEAFTSPGIDNSVTYIVIANNCIKTGEIKNNDDELLNYGLFLEVELEYLISNNIINGAMNKLAYYNLINNVDDCNIIYTNDNKRIYKKKKKDKKIEL